MSNGKIVLFIVVSALLSACNFTSPSESDLQAAARADLQALAEKTNLQVKLLSQLSRIGRDGGTASEEAVKKKLEDIGVSEITQEDLDRIVIRKIGCKDDGENAAMCDIEIKGPQNTETRQLRMVKSSQGWVEQ